MGEKLVWLHLSDMHYSETTTGWDAERVLASLTSDLKEMQEKYELRPDMIFFTGDVAFGHLGDGEGKSIASQFDQAETVFEGVRKAFSPTVARNRFFIVPGNHDVKRSAVQSIQTEWLENKNRTAKEIIACIKSGGDEWESFMKRLAEYRVFLESKKYKHLLDDPKRLTYAVVTKVKGVRVGVAGFNTAWSCGRDQEKGKLWFGGDWQRPTLFSSLDKKKAEIRVALTHHPLNWFNEYEDSALVGPIERDFHFWLHGHEHQAWVSPGNNNHIRVAAGACYQGSKKEQGYSFIRVDPDTGDVEVWLREWDNFGAAWKSRVIPGNPPLTDSNGVWRLKGRFRRPGAAAPGPAPIPGAASGDEVDVFGTPKDDPAGPLAAGGGPWQGPLRAAAAMAPEAPLAGQLPQEDIAFQVVSGRPWKDLEPSNKSPALYELRTETQVRLHFFLLEKNERRLGDWLKGRDLLFLGLPFCGKTTFLTFLSLEASRRSDSILPVVLTPRFDLPVEKAEEAVAQLKQSLKDKGHLQGGRTPVLILDNIHKPEIFAIAQRLMAAPRQWHVWAAARSTEFSDELARCEVGCPWGEADQVRDACDLVGPDEADEMVNKVFAPLLERNNEAHWVEQVRSALKEKGQVPMRVFIQVWRLVHERRGDINSGYQALIGKEPHYVDDIVRSVFPLTRAGLDALATAVFLNRPSWKLLEHVLALVDEYGAGLAAATVASLRTSLALIRDPVQPDRASMYDPVREQIKEPSNLTKSLRARIWEGVDDFLRGGTPEPGRAADLFVCWEEIAQLAGQENQLGLRVDCARRALGLAPDGECGRAHYMIAYALHNKPEPDWAGALDHYRSVLTTAPPDDLKAMTNHQIAYCLASKPEPDWEAARDALKEALALRLAGDEIFMELTFLGMCHRSAPQPNWAEAIAAYDQALKVAGTDANRAQVFFNLATCLRFKPAPDWDGALDNYRRALDLSAEPGDRANLLAWIGNCLSHRPGPDLAGAVDAYRRAATVSRNTDDSHLRALILLDLGGLLTKTGPAGDARAALQESLTLYQGVNDEAGQSSALYRRGVLETREGDHDRAIGLFQQALDIDERLKNDAGRVEILESMARTRSAQGRGEDAKELARRASDLRRKLDAIRLNELLVLMVGDRLIPVFDPEKGGPMIARIGTLRTELTADQGFLLPPVRIVDNPSLDADEYALYLRGELILKRRAPAPFAVPPGPGLTAEDAQGSEPGLGVPLDWVSQEQADEAKVAGGKVYTSADVIAANLKSAFVTHKRQIIGEAV